MAIQITDFRGQTRPPHTDARRSIGMSVGHHRVSRKIAATPPISSEGALASGCESPSDGIAQLAAIQAAMHNHPMKKTKPESAGTGLGAMLGIGFLAIASATFFMRAPLSHLLFATPSSHTPIQAAVHPIAKPGPPLPLRKAAHVAPPATAGAGRHQISSGHPGTIRGPSHPTSAQGVQPPAENSKSHRPATAAPPVHPAAAPGHRPAKFNPNNPPGALFSHTPGQ